MPAAPAIAVHASLRVPWRAARWGATLGAVCTAVWCLPAQWVASAVASVSGERVHLMQVQGSVWTGSALVMLTGGEGSRDAATLPGRLSWRLRPGWVAGGPGMRLELQQAGATQGPLQLSLQPGVGRWQWQLGPTAAHSGVGSSVGSSVGSIPATALGSWPAAWLSGLGTPFNTLALQGSMRVYAQSLQLEQVQGRWRLSGHAWLELDHLSSRLSPLTLGSYRLDVTGGPDPQPATLRLSTRQGALQLSGSGHWGTGRLRFDGQAEAAADAQAALNPLLNLIGRRDGARSIISIG